MDLAAKNAKVAKKPWPMVRLGDVCEEVRERIPSNEIQLAQYVTTDNIIKGCGGIKEAESLPVGVGLVHYHSGDVLVSNIRPYLKKTWLADRSGGCSSDVIVFRSNREDLASEYLYRVLSQDGFFDYSMQNVSGTKMPRGKRDWIKQFQFPLPPLSVQREIVARLEKELGEADRVAAKFKAIAENADAEFKAELDETFKALEEGDDVLTQRRKGAERAEDSSRVERAEHVEGRAGAPRTPQSGIVLAAKNTKSAKVQRLRLGDVCKRLSSGKNITSKNIRSQGAFPVYGANGLRGYTNQANFKGECAIIGRQGALCGNVRYFNGEAFMTDHAVVAQFVDAVDTTFMVYLLCVLDLGRLSKQAAQPGLSVKVIAEEVVTLPPLHIQRAIVARLDGAKWRCEKLKAAAERGLREAENLRKAILAEAFS